MDILGRITKLVIQRCEACGRVFPVLYKARFDSSTGVFVSDGYDYVGETCDCKADFAPDEGDPSISEWVDSLNDTRHKTVTDHAVLFEMELDASPTASELQTILNLFEPTEHLVPIAMLWDSCRTALRTCWTTTCGISSRPSANSWMTSACLWTLRRPRACRTVLCTRSSSRTFQPIFSEICRMA